MTATFKRQIEVLPTLAQLQHDADEAQARFSVAEAAKGVATGRVERKAVARLWCRAWQQSMNASSALDERLDLLSAFVSKLTPVQHLVLQALPRNKDDYNIALDKFFRDSQVDVHEIAPITDDELFHLFDGIEDREAKQEWEDKMVNAVEIDLTGEDPRLDITNAEAMQSDAQHEWEQDQ